MKKLVALFLMMIMVLTLSTVVAMADPVATTVKINGIDVRNGDYLASNGTAITGDKPASGGYAYRESGSKLVLDNFEMTSNGTNMMSLEIHATGDFTIELKGKNKLDNKDFKVAVYFASQKDGGGELTIKGPGSLEIIASNHGIQLLEYSDNGYQIIGKHSLTVSGCTLNITTENYSSHGIYNPKNLKIKNSTVNINSNYSSHGIVAENQYGFASGNILIDNSDVTINATNGLLIIRDVDFTVKNSNLELNSPNRNNMRYESSPIVLEFDNEYNVQVIEASGGTAEDITALTKEEQHAKYREGVWLKISTNRVQAEEEQKGIGEIISRGEPTPAYHEDEPIEYATPLPDTRKTAPAEEEANPNTGLSMSIAPLAFLAFALIKKK